MTGTDEKTYGAQGNTTLSRPTGPPPEQFVGLWWRHPFYRPRWRKWLPGWLQLVSEDDQPAKVLSEFARICCDSDVLLRLAFLEASHKPATQSELAKDTRRQQRIRRILEQAAKRLRDAATLLERAASEAPLIFVKAETVVPLRGTAEMCNHEMETLLWPRAVELPVGHELFTLVSYVDSCSGNLNYALVTDLLSVVYEAYGRRAPTQDAITKQVQRFRKPASIIPESIEKTISQRADPQFKGMLAFDNRISQINSLSPICLHLRVSTEAFSSH